MATRARIATPTTSMISHGKPLERLVDIRILVVRCEITIEREIRSDGFKMLRSAVGAVLDSDGSISMVRQLGAGLCPAPFVLRKA
jgi:hypothetical protein